MRLMKNIINTRTHKYNKCFSLVHLTCRRSTFAKKMMRAGLKEANQMCVQF